MALKRYVNGNAQVTENNFKKNSEETALKKLN